VTDEPKPDAGDKRVAELEARVAELEQRLAFLESEIKRVDQRLTKSQLDRYDVP
jgi:uncharacterized small protein (DUF1192 family)